jgi:hypothetical protein
VNTRRTGREDIGTNEGSGSEAIVLANGTLRPAESLPTRAPAHSDDRMSVFWRVFGGTILSIIALVAVTLYNNLMSQINDLRAELSRVHEARAELVKKEEFNSRSQNIWDRVQNLQDLRVTVSSLKEQINAQGEKTADAKALNEKLGLLEQRLKSAEEDHKVLMRNELTIAGLEQKAAAREAQIKTLEDDRKDLAKQLQELRERLAKVEGATEMKPMPKLPVPKVKDE